MRQDTTIALFNLVGTFGENKDVARDVRKKQIVPALEKKQTVILDFHKVESVTQSFIHALISELMRQYGNEVLEHIDFKNCNETVRQIITIVTDYMQERDH